MNENSNLYLMLLCQLGRSVNHFFLAEDIQVGNETKAHVESIVVIVRKRQ